MYWYIILGGYENSVLEGSFDKFLEVRFIEFGLGLFLERVLFFLMSFYCEVLGEYFNINVIFGFIGILDYIFFWFFDFLWFINLLVFLVLGFFDFEGGFLNFCYLSDYLLIGVDLVIL